MMRSNPDAITLAEAARLLGLSEIRVSALRREGLLARLDGHPSYSRADVQEFIDNPWLTSTQAAFLLGVTRTRVSQLASAGKIPVHHTASGHRVYRLKELEGVAAARAIKFRTPDPCEAIANKSQLPLDSGLAGGEGGGGSAVAREVSGGHSSSCPDSTRTGSTSIKLKHSHVDVRDGCFRLRRGR